RPWRFPHRSGHLRPPGAPHALAAGSGSGFGAHSDSRLRVAFFSTAARVVGKPVQLPTGRGWPVPPCVVGRAGIPRPRRGIVYLERALGRGGDKEGAGEKILISSGAGRRITRWTTRIVRTVRWRSHNGRDEEENYSRG